METSVTKKLNETVTEVISASSLQGFDKAFLIAKAAGELKKTLNSEYMKPIMDLQNNRLGFKTDKPEGYKEDVVKNCLIEAVLTGVQPFGNQFNIIAGNCYITKEGFGYLLANYSGLSYEIIPTLPRVNSDKTSAAIIMKIEWSIGNNEKKVRDIEFPIKMNAYMGTDAIIGKATRKARAWLYSTITGVEVGDGDVTDVESKVMDSKIIEPTIEELQALYNEKLPLLNKQEMDFAKRVIEKKEVPSYRKLKNLLTDKHE